MSFWQGKKVCVTGGAGMVGTELCSLLREAGSQVTVMDNVFAETTKYAYRFFHSDARLSKNCEELFAGQDAVFNLAARVAGVGYNASHTNEMFIHNMLLQMIPIMTAAKLKIPHYLQVSSVCVYAERVQRIGCPEQSGHSGTPNKANLGYAAAKRMGEMLVQWSTLPHAVIVRPANIYGIRDRFDLEKAHVIPSLICKAINGDAIFVKGTGKEIRDFLYVTDAARGMMLALEKGENKEAYNISDNGKEKITIKDLVTLIQDVTRTKDKKVIFQGGISGDSERWVCAEKIKRLGYETKISLREGLERTVQWYVEQLSSDRTNERQVPVRA